VGIPCGGFYHPDICAVEPLRDEATLTTGMAGLGLGVLSSQRFAVALTADVRAGLVRADTRGLMSGQSISASKTIWGGDVGAEGTWMPWAHLPIAVEVSAAIGGLTPVSSDQILDAYTPFESSFTVKRLSVGVAWSPRPR
jgi:hypothetical protein